MPATSQLFSTLLNPAGSPPDVAKRTAWSGLGLALTGFLEKLAPEGYEDDTGFHLQPTMHAGRRGLMVEPNCLGEHI